MIDHLDRTPCVDRRHALSAYAGQRVPVAAVVVRTGRYYDKREAVWRDSTLLKSVKVGDVTLGHTWLNGVVSANNTVPTGQRVRMSCRVDAFEFFDVGLRAWATRYGLFAPEQVKVIGPANVLDEVKGLVGLFGWQAVADAVEALYRED